MHRDVVDLLTDLVSVDSVNPSLVPGAAGEGGAAAHVRRWADAAGLSTRVLETHPARPSVVVRGGAARGGTTLLLCGHLDTVGVGGMAEPFVPRTVGDQLYGRGAYDMKAGLAALIACRDAARTGIGGEVVVAAVADEEHASIGVREVLEHVHADAAIVTEPTELVVATAHKGFAWTEIEIIGRAAHGSRPHLGVDAIFNAGPVLVALAELNARLQRTGWGRGRAPRCGGAARRRCRAPGLQHRYGAAEDPVGDPMLDGRIAFTGDLVADGATALVPTGYMENFSASWSAPLVLAGVLRYPLRRRSTPGSPTTTWAPAWSAPLTTPKRRRVTASVSPDPRR